MGLEVALVGAVATYLGTSTLVAGVIVGTAEIALAVGLSYAAQLLTPDPNSSSRLGKKDRPSVGTTVPRCMVIGKTATAGSVVHDNVYGNDKRHLQIVYALSDTTCEDLIEVVVDGETKNLTGGAPSGGNDGTFQVQGYNDHFEVRWFRGSPTQNADNQLVAHANPSNWWANNHRLRNIAYVSITLEYRAKEFPSKTPPSLLWVMEGTLLYDPRKDGTVPGGSGAHRFNDPSTWQYSRNPYVALYHYLRGYWVSGELWVGAGWAEDEIDVQSFMTAANICDQNVSRPDGSTSNRYSIDTIWYGGRNANHDEVVNQVMLATAGKHAIRGGKFWVAAGAAVTPVVTFFDSDLEPSSPVAMSSKRPAGGGLFNEIYATYLAADRDWQTKELAPRKDASALAEDGKRLETSIDFNMVTDRWQARQLMRIFLKASRQQWNGRITLLPQFLGIEPGDVVRWQSSMFGWTKDFEVQNWEDRDDELLNVTLSLQETAASVYDPDADNIPPTAIVNPLFPPDLADVTGFDADPTMIVGANGKRKAAANIFWDPPDDYTIDALVIQVRRVGATNIVADRIDEVEDGEATITKGLGTSGAHEVRASWLRQEEPKERNWTAWTPVTLEPDDDAGAGAKNAQRIHNAAFRRTTRAWTIGQNATGLTWTIGRNQNVNKTLIGGNTLYVLGTGSPPTGTTVNLLNSGFALGQYPVEAGALYEVAGLLGVVGCTGAPVVRWFDDTGTLLSQSVGTDVSGKVGGKRRADYVKAYDTFTAPANAATAQIGFRITVTGAANPVLYVTEPYFGDAEAGQLGPSTWTNGLEELPVDEVDTSQLTALAVTTAKLDDVSATTSKIAPNAVSVGESNYTAGQIQLNNPPASTHYEEFDKFRAARTSGSRMAATFSWSLMPDTFGSAERGVRIYREQAGGGGRTLIFDADRYCPIKDQISTGSFECQGEMWVDFVDNTNLSPGNYDYSIEFQSSGVTRIKRRYNQWTEFKR